MAIINSTDLMYNTLLSCRVRSANAEVWLQWLQHVLHRARQSGALNVTVEEAWLEQVFGESARWVRGYGALDPTDLTELGPQNQRFFDLVDISQTDLTRLCARKAWNAMGNLGYALHNVPGFIRQPEAFNPGRFQFSFRIAAYNWNELSGDLQHALSGIMNMDLDKATRLSGTKGFAINNTLEKPIPFNEVKPVLDWTDPSEHKS